MITAPPVTGFGATMKAVEDALKAVPAKSLE